jgi:hypothetical protein
VNNLCLEQNVSVKQSNLDQNVNRDKFLPNLNIHVSKSQIDEAVSSSKSMKKLSKVKLNEI